MWAFSPVGVNIETLDNKISVSCKVGEHNVILKVMHVFFTMFTRYFLIGDCS